MNAFQWVSLPILTFLFIGGVSSAFRGRGSRRVALFWSAIWLSGGICIAFPDVTRRLATALGVKRGADLVSYAAILTMLIGFFMIYARLQRLEATITRLTRHLALQNPMPPAGEAPTQASSPAEPPPRSGNRQ